VQNQDKALKFLCNSGASHTVLYVLSESSMCSQGQCSNQGDQGVEILWPCYLLSWSHSWYCSSDEKHLLRFFPQDQKRPI